jgi:aryl-alcohol dehydrogenase-like predicted oxidoreductase
LLVEGWQKAATLDFLLEGRTLGQAALRWVLADPNVATTLPNIYGAEQIAEFTADVANLSDSELDRVAELHERNFDVAPLADQTTKVNADT